MATTPVRLRSAARRDDGEAIPLSAQVRELWSLHWPILVSLLVLVLIAIILYLVSTWSAVRLSESAETLAQSVRQVLAAKGDSHALQRELLLRLIAIEHRDDFSQAMLHLAIAFVVAIVIIVTVELYSTSRTRREINEYRDSVAQEVWTALSGRLVPTTVVDEIRGILKADVVKEDVRYVLTFMQYAGLPPEYVVLQRKVTYVLRNLTGRRVYHNVRSFIQNVSPDTQCHDKTGMKIILPRHRELKVNGVAVELSESHQTLMRNAQGQLRDLQYQVTLGRKDERAEVFILTEEQVPLGGQNSYVQTIPVTGLTVSIDNKIDDLIKVRDVDFAHPNWEDFVAEADGAYRYSGAVLPGQSFSVFWEPIHHPAKVVPGMKS